MKLKIKIKVKYKVRQVEFVEIRCTGCKDVPNRPETIIFDDKEAK